MELIVVYLLLCLVIIVSFFVIPWVNWQRCEPLNRCSDYCCCCWDRADIDPSIMSPQQQRRSQLGVRPPNDTVISVKPTAGQPDVKLSPTPSYSQFAPPDYDEVVATMTVKPPATIMTENSTRNASQVAAMTAAASTVIAGKMLSRPSRTLAGMFGVESKTKRNVVEDDVPSTTIATTTTFVA